MSKFVKIPLIAVCIALAFFVVTFVIYMFNLDMKAMTFLAPLLEKWYDNLPRDHYV